MASGAKSNLLLILCTLTLLVLLPGSYPETAAQPFDKERWEQIRKGVDYSESPPKPLPELKPPPKIPEFSKLRSLVKIALIVLVAAILVFLIVWLMMKEGRRVKVKRNLEYMVNEENDIRLPVANLREMLRQAFAAGDIRSALRCFYLMQLNLLEGEQMITLDRVKTNHQYLKELRGTAWHPHFSTLTIWYEAAWFGEIPVKKEVFQQLITPWQQLKGNEKIVTA
jgi:hypothetical protein